MANNIKNKLKNEVNPYLLHHSDNPIEWLPWSEQAIEKSKIENKPIFLSIGYSSCHWCHVMEKESFTDLEVAEYLNQNFISIKVDKEERPDIDNIYMYFCQIMNGSGGWPLTIFMDSSKIPFFVGTYFPRDSNYHRIGFLELLKKVTEQWINSKDKIKSFSENLLYAINNENSNTEGEFNKEVFSDCFHILSNQFDNINGGFGSRPKFPSAHQLDFLLRYYYNTKDPNALEIVSKTLLKIRMGGIYDQIAGGFHRYSVDEKWQVPHFEKMLYDQAALIKSYSELYQITKFDYIKDTILETVDNIKSIFLNESAFYSSTDADSDGEEGTFYLWTYEELNESLTEEEFDILTNYYDINLDGNYLDESTRKINGKNILFLKANFDLEDNIEYQKYRNLIKPIFQKLFIKRNNRTKPFIDNKVLTDWNCFLASSLSIAGRSLNNKVLIQLAINNYQFIKEKLIVNNELYHSYIKSKVYVKAFLDDYAYLTNLAFELYNTTFEESYLVDAKKFLKQTNTLFWDDKNFCYFFNNKNQNENIINKKEFYDGAIPSGNSMMMNNLIKSYKFFGDKIYLEKYNQIIFSISKMVNQNPINFTHLINSYFYHFGKSFEIVYCPNNNSKIEDYLKITNDFYHPHTISIFRKFGDDKKITELAAQIINMNIVNNQDTIYICNNYYCNEPINDFNQIRKYVE